MQQVGARSVVDKRMIEQLVISLWIISPRRSNHHLQLRRSPRRLLEGRLQLDPQPRLQVCSARFFKGTSRLNPCSSMTGRECQLTWEWRNQMYVSFGETVIYRACALLIHDVSGFEFLILGSSRKWARSARSYGGTALTPLAGTNQMSIAH